MSDANTSSGDAPRDPFEETRRAFNALPGAEAMRGAQAVMGLDPARLGEAFRTMTQSSLEQSREAYGRMRSVADEATRTLEATVDQAHSGSLNLTRRAIEGLRAQAEMNFEHLQKLSTVGSFSELLELQTRYLRRQIELTTDQARAMQEMTRSAADDLMRPAREAAEQTSQGNGENR